MYKIYCDDLCIYDPSNDSLESTVVSPKLSISDNTAGSLKFTMPITNVGYDKYSVFKSNIKVYNDDKIIWRGRIISDAEDFNQSRAIECEGALAFLNDTIQPARYATIGDVIAVHNSRVTADRQIKMGEIALPLTLTYLMSYQTTYEAVSKLVEKYGWHMRIRCVGEDLYLDILQNYLGSNAQTIEFGVNLLDFTSTFDVTDLTTVIIPRGQSTKAEDSDVETYITIESVNNGSIYLESQELVAMYGEVEKTVDWPNITKPQTLLSLAQAYLSDYQFDGLVLDVSVLDMHVLNPEITSIGLLDMIHCVSAPHGMDRYFPVTKMEIDLSNPAGTTITLNKAKSAPMSEQASDISDDMGDTNDKINRVEEKIDEVSKDLDPKTILDQAKADARDLISSATGGYVTMVMDENEDHVEELVISNTEDWTQADQYWRWNINGLGYFDSSDPQGIKVAMTMDGQIVADLITVGTMSSDRIKGGTLELGNYDGQPGRIFMYDGKGEEIGSWSESGITATKGVFKGSIESGDFNRQGIRIDDGIIYGYAHGTSQGYIDTGKDINGDHDNYLGAGFRMANRVGILIKTPLLGTNTEYVDPPEGGVYMKGMTGAITLTADMGVSADGLTYQTKTLHFVNGLMVTSLADTSGGGDSGGGDSSGDGGGSTGGDGGGTGTTDANPFVVHRGDYITPIATQTNQNRGVLDLPLISDKGANLETNFVISTTSSPIIYGWSELFEDKSATWSGRPIQVTADPQGNLHQGYCYPADIQEKSRYNGPLILPLCTSTICDTNGNQNDSPHFVAIYQKDNASSESSWVITNSTPGFTGDTINKNRAFQTVTVDRGLFNNNGPNLFWDDSLEWADNMAVNIIASRYMNHKGFYGADSFEKRIKDYDPSDSLNFTFNGSTNIFGMGSPYYYNIYPSYAGWAIAYDIMNGDMAFHLMHISCSKSQAYSIPPGANAEDKSWYTNPYSIYCSYGFYHHDTENAWTKLIRPCRIHPDSVNLIPLYKPGGFFEKRKGKVMSHAQIYAFPTKADADEFVNRFTTRDYETQESIETDFQDRFLYWHNPQNRERSAMYISTTNNGLYPIY